MKYIESRLWAIAVLIIGVMLPSAAWAEGGHQLTVVAKPTMAGSFNANTAELMEGDTIHLYAYANANFSFLRWTDEKGNVVSQQMDFTYEMPSRNVILTAEYEYNPANPANPAHNYWNKNLGEVIVDDFATGSLQNAVKNVIGENNAADVTMITVAGVVNANDLGIVNTYSACSLLDLSRVTGIIEVPSYAFDYSKLESVYLPAAIEKIGYRAFYGCKQLSSLIVYAMTPPTLENNVFTNVSEGLVVYVPAAAIAQYQEAAGWKDFTILPIQEDIRSITISLPEGTNTLDYKQMWLELTNTKSGQRMHYVMTDRQIYTFANIIRNTTWNVTLRNERGDVFGQINNVEVKDEDVSVTFALLSKPQNVSLVVHTPDGNDVTSQVQVTWTDAHGKYVAQGVSLSGLPIGYKVNYRMALSQELAMQFDTPATAEYTLKDGGNALICQLQAIKKLTISGKVKDATTGLPLNGAIISASQTFGGKYSRTLNAKTDGKGVFSIEIFNVPTSVAIAATDYVSQMLDYSNNELGGLAEYTIPDVSLKSITGATISVGFTYTTVEGETQNWYSDYQNVSYSLYNITRKKPISQFNVQYPQIVLLEEVDDGDVLRMTTSSRTNAFKAVEATVTVVEQKAEAMFAITELGRINASFTKTRNASVVGSLYDASGKLVKTYNYSETKLTISDLADGNYTLVSMGSSRLFNTIFDLAQLPQTGLTEGADYVQNTVEVTSGTISTVIIEEVPMLDESKLYYTGDNTLFTVNKPSIVVGNYLTLTGRIDFKPAYANGVSNVQMIVDLPESCQFVDNSVMVGNSTSSYTLSGHQITIPMARYTDRVRFCVIPTLGGEYAPSAFAQFDLNGETVTQPIGSTNYTAKDLSISVPSTVAKTSVPVSGTAIGTSNVEIYDNGMLIGQTTSLANGTWATTCELNEPYNLSVHNIVAKVITKSGIELRSETVECLHDKNAIEVKSVTMINTAHVAGSLTLKEYVTVFDFQNPGKSIPAYWYWPSFPDFTFIADLTVNDTTSVQGVTFYINTDNKEVREIKGTYDKMTNMWIGRDRFYSNSLPINVNVKVYCSYRKQIDSSVSNEIIGTLTEFISDSKAVIERSDSISNAIDKALAEENIDFDYVDYLISLYDGYESVTDENNDDEEDLSDEKLSELVATMVSRCTPEIEQISREIDEIVNAVSTFNIYKENEVQSDNGSFHMKRTISPCKGISKNWLIDNGYVHLDNTGNDGIYEKVSDNEYGYVDFTRNLFIHIINIDERLNASSRSKNKDSNNWRDHIYDIYFETSKTLSTNEELMTYDHLNKISAKDKANYQKLRMDEAEASIYERIGKRNLSRTSDPVRQKYIKKDLKDVAKVKRDIGKAKAKHTRVPKYLSTAAKSILSVYDWKSWHEKVQKCADRIDSWEIPMCIYSIKPQMVPVLVDKIDEIKKDFSNYYGWQFARKAVYNVADGLTGPIIGTMLAVYEDGVERHSDEHFERNLNSDIMLVEKWLTDMYHACGKVSPYEDLETLFPFTPVSHVMDPSGYVYEGVTSNRIEGVTATAYYKETVEDMYGDLHENVVKWDASEYAQENPLYTDENGMYAWDVPNGLWQVKFEKDGYETAYSEWLPVPPPQLDVNIAMKQNVQPTVKMAHAYEDAVEVEFDKYMMPELLTTDNIFVMQGNETVAGSVELLNNEASYEEGDETFASKIRFNAAQPFTEQEITLIVSNRVKSYAGIRMQDDYQQKFSVEQEIKQIVSDSLTYVRYSGKVALMVRVLPVAASKGKMLSVKTSSPMILGVETEHVAIGDDGKADFILSGKLPGVAALTFSMEGTDKTALTIVNVEQNTTVAAPTASLASGTLVEKGTTTELLCKTQGATIYYTTDGSCPCNEDTRQIYNGTPIIINSNTVIKAMASVPGLEDSAVAVFMYIVTLGDANGDGVVSIADVTAIINKINGVASDIFNEAAADVNGDGLITIADVTGVINIINKER